MLGLEKQPGLGKLRPSRQETQAQKPLGEHLGYESWEKVGEQRQRGQASGPW